MVPALRMRISSRSLSAWNLVAAARMDLKEHRSSGMYRMSTGDDICSLMEAMASCALLSVRAPRYMRAGRCFASWRMVSRPMPALPVEIKKQDSVSLAARALL